MKLGSGGKYFGNTALLKKIIFTISFRRHPGSDGSELSILSLKSLEILDWIQLKCGDLGDSSVLG